MKTLVNVTQRLMRQSKATFIEDTGFSFSLVKGLCLGRVSTGLVNPENSQRTLRCLFFVSFK